MKKLLIVFLCIVAVGGIGFILYKNFSKKTSQELNSPTLVYNEETGKWESVQNIPRINKEDLDTSTKDPNESGFYNLSVLQGYFDHYDEKSDTITIKSLLSFTMGRQYEIVELKAPVDKTVYCAPAITIVPKTGKEIPTQSLAWPTKNGQTLKIIGERLISFDELIQEAGTNTYLFVQLTQNFDKNKTSYIKKLIVIGLCN